MNDLPITVARTYYADNIFEQMIPVMYWGRDYYTAPLLSPMSGDRIRIVAADYYTRVRVNDGETTNVYYLPGDGGWIEIDVDPATHITSDLPIGVAQYAKGMSAAGEGDPFEMLIMPTSRFRKDYRFYIPDGYDTDDFDETQDPPVPGGGSYVTIIAPTVGTRVELDGDLIVAWTSLPDGGGYAKQIVYPGEHTITSDHPVGVYCHGYKFAGSYGYPAGFQVYLAYIWPATIRASPPTFNLFSPHSARWYTAYIELPEGVYVGDIDRTTILLNETIPVDPFWTEIQSVIGDYDNDTIPDLMVKFDRDAVANFILERVELKRAKSYWYAYVTLTVTGEVVGAPFEGSDTIKAVMPIRSG